MSDTLADLAAWLPSEFLADHHMDTQNFPSPPSTASESSDDGGFAIAGFTRCFSRSVSLQEPRNLPYNLQKKRGFSGSPESTLNWSASGYSPGPALETAAFVETKQDAWELMHAANEVARLQMRMGMYNVKAVAGKNGRGLTTAPRPIAHSHCSVWRSERDELPRMQQSWNNRGVFGGESCCCCGGGGGGGGGVRPPALPRPPWPALQPQNQHRSNLHQPSSRPVMKPVFLGAYGGGATVKRQYAGTGVFLPRRYCNTQPESRKKQACSPAPLPPSNRNFDPIIGQAPPAINGGFVSPYGVLMAARKTGGGGGGGGAAEAPASNVEAVLPQEWTY